MSNMLTDDIAFDTLSPPFKSKLTVSPTQFNLFTGKNGSGKTYLLDRLTLALKQVAKAKKI